MFLSIFEQFLIVFLVFAPFEQLFPLHEGKKVLRPQWRTDLTHLFVSGFLIGMGSIFVLRGLLQAVGPLMPEVLGTAIRSQPFLLQLVEVFLIADLGFYLMHRAFHTVPFLWRFHRVHHSIEKLDTLAAHRVHPLDQILTHSASIAPVLILGFSVEAIAMFILVYRLQSLFIHSAIKTPKGGWLRHIIALPQFHHWHHADVQEAYDKNFSGQLPFIDRLFGTLYLPGDEMPTGYGIEDHMPERYLEQLIDPFRGMGTEPQAEVTPGFSGAITAERDK